MNDSLEQITKSIEWYSKTKNAPPQKLVEVLRVITTNLYTLEHHRSEFKKQFEAMIYTKVNEGDSVARAVNYAEIEVPELYMLRRIMNAGYEVVGSLRTQVSFLKQELNNLQ